MYILFHTPFNRLVFLSPAVLCHDVNDVHAYGVFKSFVNSCTRNPTIIFQVLFPFPTGFPRALRDALMGFLVASRHVRTRVLFTATEVIALGFRASFDSRVLGLLPVSSCVRHVRSSWSSESEWSDSWKRLRPYITARRKVHLGRLSASNPLSSVPNPEP
jgi:hypothetical protein